MGVMNTSNKPQQFRNTNNISLIPLYFRGIGCIFTEMIAGTYLYLCLFSGELVVYLQR